MVLPEDASDRDPPRRRTRTPITVIAVLVLTLGALAVGALTGTDESEPAPAATPETPNPTTATTTTTTRGTAERSTVDDEDFSVADIAQGEPLAWEHFMSIDEGYPLAMFEHHGSVYLLATDTANPEDAVEGGLRVWRSENGTDWESLGQVIDGSHVITSVATIGEDLMAAEKGEPGEGFTVWRSREGRLWESETIEVPGLTRNTTVLPTAIGGSEHTLLVATTARVDVQTLVQGRLAAILGEDGLPESLSWRPLDLDTDPIELVVWGPLGFPLFEITGEDLGLTESERSLVEEQFGGRPIGDLWVSTDEGEWRRTESPTPWVESIMARPEGGIIVTGFGNGGPELWVSVEGLNWHISPRNIFGVEKWNDILVGAAGILSTLVRSDDGEQWEMFDTLQRWPGGLRWGVTDLAAGSGGIAASVYHVPNAEVHVEALDTGPVLLRDDASTLKIDFSNGTYTLDSDGLTRTWSMGLNRPPEIGVILSDGLITFHDPDTDRLLASFEIDELFEARDAYWSSRVTDLTDHRAFIFSADGEDWVIQDVAAMGNLEISRLEVTNTHVVAAAVDQNDPFPFDRPPGFEIWSALIP